MKIGELAQACGLSRDTLRYYDKLGLLPAAHRSPSGYRNYSQEDLLVLHFVMRLKELGFTLQEIRDFLALRGQSQAPSRLVKEAIGHKLVAVQHKIGKLQELEQSLQQMSALCDGAGSIRECPIMRALQAEHHPPSRR